MTNALYEAYTCFNNYLGNPDKYTYDSWKSIPENDKVAALYVNFFNQITLAVYKAHRPGIDIESVVEYIIQYLDKNVDKIVKDSDRFSEGYIYRVVYNCVYCIGESQSDINRINLNVSNICKSQDGYDELDLFDTVSTKCDSMNWYDDSISSMFWGVVESIKDDRFQEYVSRLCGNGIEDRVEYIQYYLTDDKGNYVKDENDKLVIKYKTKYRLSKKSMERYKEQLKELLLTLPECCRYGYDLK